MVMGFLFVLVCVDLVEEVMEVFFDMVSLIVVVVLFVVGLVDDFVIVGLVWVGGVDVLVDGFGCVSEIGVVLSVLVLLMGFKVIYLVYVDGFIE